MAKLSVIDLSGAKVGDLDVSDAVFDVEVKEHLLWEVVRSQRAAKRAGTHKVKGRSEVYLTKAKVYKQKGTGHARHGSKRTNLYPKGGRVHGPVPHKYILNVNKKAMAGALRSALTVRARAGDLVVVKAFEVKGDDAKRPRTKVLAAALAKAGAERALLVDKVDNQWLVLSSRNLPRADFIDVSGLNVYDILRHPKLLISEACVRTLEERLGAGGAG